MRELSLSTLFLTGRLCTAEVQECFHQSSFFGERLGQMVSELCPDLEGRLSCGVNQGAGITGAMIEIWR